MPEIEKIAKNFKIVNEKNTEKMCIERKLLDITKIKHNIAELRKLARYGLGCAVFTLDKKELKRYYLSLVKGDKIDQKLIKKALPIAYPIALKDCTEYFLSFHNNAVFLSIHYRSHKFDRELRMEELGIPIGLPEKEAANFCLARKGRLEEIKMIKECKKEELEKLNYILNSSLASLLKFVGIVAFDDGERGAVLLDPLIKEVSVGDTLVTHRYIACEKIIGG